MGLTNKLSAIGDAIREKTGKTDLMTLDQMPVEIASITTGGGGSGGEMKPIVLTGNCKYACSGVIATAYLKEFGNTVSTDKITNASNLFEYNRLERIPFALHFDKAVFPQIFANMNLLKEAPEVSGSAGAYENAHSMFANCYNLETIPESWGNLTWNRGFYSVASLFQNCQKLTHIPVGLLQNVYMDSGYPYSYADSIFSGCWSLKEIVGFVGAKGKIDSNKYSYNWDGCFSLKRMVFDMPDGNPMILPWKNQTIDLCYAGYVYPTYQVSNFMSTTGKTYDTRITDDATYQALKDNENSWTSDVNYSSYNHTSAVETINSLPDCSATGTNTIKFMGNAGALTDGGAINTMTEEEIAVATAKGWSIALV